MPDMTRSLPAVTSVLFLMGAGGFFGVSEPKREDAIVLTQLPVRSDVETPSPPADGMLRADYGEGARVVIVDPDQRVRILSTGLVSAADADISFDGERIVFAGKKEASGRWNIYEIGIDGSGLRQITRDLGDCRQPIYLSTLYTIISPEPWYQVAFTSTEAGELNEYGAIPAGHLYTCRLDGTGVRRLTFNLSSDMDPFLMPDGRLLYATWQRSTLHRGPRGRISLFAVNNDGTDVSVFSADEGPPIKHMPCTTTNGLAVFVTGERVPWDGAGRLAAVTLRRPHHSYREITGRMDGLFHSPSPLPDGMILVSRRPGDGSATHGVYRLQPETGEYHLVFDDPDYHDVQAKLLRARPEPDGRSSVVTEEDPYGQFYCLDVSVSDLRERSWIDPTVSRLRVLEGLARKPHDSDPDCNHGIPPIVQKRILGDIPLEKDGSFYIKVPANTPVQLQVLDESGMALRTCSWIWAKNHEPRGCIGCHEDPELTPENRFIDAVQKAPVELTLPAEKRRTVDFRRDVAPIIEKKCATAGCHDVRGVRPGLGDGGDSCYGGAYRNLVSPEGGYVVPGRARTSPLIWSLFGKDTSRPWDDAHRGVVVVPMPPPGSEPLTRDEIGTFIEWIDMGALWDGIPDGGVEKEAGGNP